MTQAEGNKTAIKRIVESFFSSQLITSHKISFKFRAYTCQFIRVYLEVFPEATFVFIKRSPLDWAQSCSSKFKWSAIKMLETYKYAHESYEILASSKAELLLLDYDNLEKWPIALTNSKNLLEKDLVTKFEYKIKKELNKDSQSGFIDNNNNDFDKKEVEKFMSMDLPTYSW